MINNRQANNGRRRGRGGQRQHGGNPNQGNGNRIDSRARGNAAQLLEKYKNLAREAQMQGDRVNTEYYLQFADHYFRVLAETRLRFEEQNPGQTQQGRRPSTDIDGDDDDYGMDGEGQRGVEGDAGFENEPRGQERYDRASRESQRDGQRDAPAIASVNRSVTAIAMRCPPGRCGSTCATREEVRNSSARTPSAYGRWGSRLAIKTSEAFDVKVKAMVQTGG